MLLSGELAREQAQLEEVARRHTATQREARRARIILAWAETGSIEHVAHRAGVSVRTAYEWCRRFRRERLAGLEDRPRSGNPIRYGPVERLQIISMACEPAPQEEGIHGWTVDRIREETVKRGIVKGISRSEVHRILNEGDLKPHKVRGWVHSPDPEFKEKVQEITDLYLNPGAESVVVSIDEKTVMQATERKYPDEPARPGRPLRREFEYVRHGTQSLIAGLNVHTGKVTARCGSTRKARDLLQFMHQVAREYPGVFIDVIWDNLNIHGGERWEQFNRAHGGRFRFHYTPLHASWVNQIELWFGILQTKCLKHGSFASRPALKDAVLRFARTWNRRLARPFRWTFKGYPLQTGLGELKEAG